MEIKTGKTANTAKWSNGNHTNLMGQGSSPCGRFALVAQLVRALEMIIKTKGLRFMIQDIKDQTIQGMIGESYKANLKANAERTTYNKLCFSSFIHPELYRLPIWVESF